jgi:dTDP-glucose 4,6-dehydratase
MASERRVAVLGAAGFIGSHLSDRLLAEGHRVLGVDNLITGTRRNLEHLSREPRFELVERDICAPLEDLGTRFDAVLDLASPASPVDYLRHPFETLHVGSVGVENALRLAKRAGAVFLLSSTSEVYGDPLEHPQKETYWGHVDPIGPRSVYDEAKRFAEAITMAYHRYHGIDTRIVRIFNTYGPRMRKDDGRVIPNFITQALAGEPLTVYGDGMQTRSFCYVDDLIEGLYRLLLSDEHQPVNLGNPREMTVRELAEAVNRITGNRGGIVALPERRGADDPQRRRPDISRAIQILGWEPADDLEVGLRKTIDDFRRRS